ncbi:MAG TPA: hypothetical protein VMS96_14190, partial [Terriglobales bacterium]|nr:hypothetical protein [Terriglobales bacterium]
MAVESRGATRSLRQGAFYRTSSLRAIFLPKSSHPVHPPIRTESGCGDPHRHLCALFHRRSQEYLIERGFNRYRGKLLGLTPIYLSSTTRIKGLIRLLSIGLRVLCLM